MTTSRIRIGMVVIALGGPIGFAQEHHAAETAMPPARLLEGLGSHHHKISTSNPEAQRFFDQGLTLLFGFNHGGAIRMFERAATLDPKAPMPLWAIALAYGPNINDFEMDRDRAKMADDYVQKARAVASNGTQKERAYIEALAARYSIDPNADLKQLQVSYKDAMGALARRYPDDIDAATLYAESLMDLRPWQLWTIDGRPSDVTGEVIRVLESVLARDPLHPGANHYYIHTMEASPNPEKALPSARRLETLVPAAGHLVHMPAHIYARTGRFVQSANSNAAAAAVDERYVARTRTPPGLYRLMYYNHNIHFESYAASMAGQHARATRTADKLARSVSPFVTDMPMLEGFLPQQVFVALRFGRWDEALAFPPPDPSLKLLGVIAHYARGVAFAGKSDLVSARSERDQFAAASREVPPDTLIGILNTAGQLFAVANAVLDGRIAAAAGDRARAIGSFRAAVNAQDTLTYDEPPTWYYPVRETLGAALLANGQAADAEQVFREDLKYNPRNGRSLFGLWKSLDAQGKKAEAAKAQADFTAAWRSADVALRIEGL